MKQTRSKIDPGAERAKRFSIGAFVATIGLCCAVKVLLVASLAFSGAATAARSWARVALVVLAVVALAGSVVFSRRRRRCEVRASEQAENDEECQRLEPGSNGASSRAQATSRRATEEFTIGSGTTKA